MTCRHRGSETWIVTGGQQLVVFASTLGIGWLMLKAGLAKKRLAWREPGTCRRCGRSLETCSCRNRRRG